MELLSSVHWVATHGVKSVKNADEAIPVYSQRNMKTYCITETELDNISSYDKRAKSYYAIASFLFSIFISFISNWNSCSIFEKTILVAVIIISGLMVYLGHSSDEDKDSVINIIKNESVSQIDSQDKNLTPLT